MMIALLGLSLAQTCTHAEAVVPAGPLAVGHSPRHLLRSPPCLLQGQALGKARVRPEPPPHEFARWQQKRPRVMQRAMQKILKISQRYLCEQTVLSRVFTQGQFLRFLSFYSVFTQPKPPFVRMSSLPGEGLKDLAIVNTSVLRGTDILLRCQLRLSH